MDFYILSRISAKTMKLAVTSMLVPVLIGFSTPSWSFFIDETLAGATDGVYSTDVGNLDVFRSYTDNLGLVGDFDLSNGIDTSVNGFNSCDALNGIAKEDCWVESVLGFPVDYSDPDKAQTVSMYAVYDDNLGNTQTSNTGAVALMNGPGWYLLKNTSDDWFLFNNEINLDWGVFDFSMFPVGANIGNNSDQWVISHVGSIGGTPVPEPSIVALFAAGLLGLGMSRRRRNA